MRKHLRRDIRAAVRAIWSTAYRIDVGLRPDNNCTDTCNAREWADDADLSDMSNLRSLGVEEIDDAVLDLYVYDGKELLGNLTAVTKGGNLVAVVDEYYDDVMLKEDILMRPPVWRAQGVIMG